MKETIIFPKDAAGNIVLSKIHRPTIRLPQIKKIKKTIDITSLPREKRQGRQYTVEEALERTYEVKGYKNGQSGEFNVPRCLDDNKYLLELIESGYDKIIRKKPEHAELSRKRRYGGWYTIDEALVKQYNVTRRGYIRTIRTPSCLIGSKVKLIKVN